MCPLRDSSASQQTAKVLFTWADSLGAVAVAEVFEPSDGGYPSHAFEACSLGRSDTPPAKSLPAGRTPTPITGRRDAPPRHGRGTPPSASRYACTPLHTRPPQSARRGTRHRARTARTTPRG